MNKTRLATWTLLLFSQSPSMGFSQEADDAKNSDYPSIQECLDLPAKIRPDYPKHQAWIDGSHYVIRATEKGENPEWLSVDAASGTEKPLFDRDAMVKALAALPGVDAATATSWASKSDFQFSGDHRSLLINDRNDLFFARFGGEAVRLTHDPSPELGERISPDGSMVAFLRDDNLHVVGTDGSDVLPLTDAGGNDTLLGRLDWVYQEEIYGRGNWQGYWWSPDSKRLAFIALDESPVPAYTIVDHRKTRPDVEVWRYPKAGDPNPIARVGIVDAAGGDVRWVDLSAYEREEFLVVRVAFTPDSSEVILQIQNRVQTWLDVVSADVATGATRRLFRDETGVWVEPTDAPFFTPDGERFLWLSERDGFRHLYLYSRTGDLVRRLTEGPWEVDGVHGVDSGGEVWFDADRGDVKGRRLHRVALEGGGAPTVVTPEAGTHQIEMSPSFAYFRDDYSSLTDPGSASIRDAAGGPVRLLASGTTQPIDGYDLPIPEFVTLKGRDGEVLEGMMIKPRGYQPGVRYPVFTYIYGGPHAPQVLDRFFNRDILWHRMLAARGYLIWCCDNRSASGKGLDSVKGIYQNMGEQELRDLEDSIDWLVSEGLADADRVGLWGWSYGGYMTAYALTHSKKFKMGIVGAPVTDWRFYDSIYTERYMHLPQVNVEGYARSSVVKSAGDLHGQMLLIHGSIDENVHLQNSMQFAQALQEAGKSFDLMIYPGNRHSVRNPGQRRHLYQMMADYVVEHL